MNTNTTRAFIYHTMSIRVTGPDGKEVTFSGASNGSLDGGKFLPDSEVLGKLLADYAVASINSIIQEFDEYREQLQPGLIREELLQEINQENWQEWVDPAQAVLDKLHSMYQDSIGKEDTGLME